MADAEMMDFEANRLFAENCREPVARATLDEVRAAGYFHQLNKCRWPRKSFAMLMDYRDEEMLLRDSVGIFAERCCANA